MARGSHRERWALFKTNFCTLENTEKKFFFASVLYKRERSFSFFYESKRSF